MSESEFGFAQRDVALDRLGSDIYELRDCWLEAMDQWLALPPEFRATVEDRTRAGILRDSAVDAARRRFGGRTDVRIIEKDQRLVFQFRDEIQVRFKKLDGVGLPCENYTQGSFAFRSNQSLPGMEALPRVTAGYRLDATGLELLDVMLTPVSVDGFPAWQYIIPEQAAEVVSLPVEAVADSERTTVVRPKRQEAKTEKGRGEDKDA